MLFHTYLSKILKAAICILMNILKNQIHRKFRKNWRLASKKTKIKKN